MGTANRTLALGFLGALALPDTVISALTASEPSKNLLACDEVTFLRFVEQCVHPLVQSDDKTREEMSIRTVLTPIATPQANAIAEHLIGTLRRECLDHLIVVNERHLRHVLGDFIRHYNAARPHQALQLQVPDERARASPANIGRIVSRPVLGGLTHEYEREAA